jgi:hypothetical protein
LRVYAFPADSAGCGFHRIEAPAEVLQRQGVDVVVVPPKDRQLPVELMGDEVVSVAYPADAEVMVFQRVTHRHLVNVIRCLVRQGVAVVLDIDDDLSCIHPGNPAWQALHPRANGRSEHSWNNLLAAAREATMVVVSSDALLPRYAAHGRGRVVRNYLAERYFGLPREDSDVIGFPGAIWSHPDDPQVTRPAIPRLIREGASFRIAGDSEGIGAAFGLERDPPGTGPVALEDWPKVVAGLGIGIAPLADTRFNQAKSWLKGAEMSAAGVPWVASPRVEYRKLHALGTGILADRPKDWLRELRQLRASFSLRQELSAAGRQVAAEHLRLETQAWRHAEAWSDALALQRGKAPAATVV